MIVNKILLIYWCNAVIDETVIGKGGVTFGTTAKLTAPFAQGPAIPGPERKKPKTSLYEVFSKPKYSWDVYQTLMNRCRYKIKL